MSNPSPRQAYRFPPCPAYDVEGTESWLGSMAEQGLILSRDGFFCGFAIFDRAEPQVLRYRLDAAAKKPSFWAQDQSGPEEEALALNERCGWEYVAPRGQFYIYRTASPQAREMHTDPAVQALALNQVCRRQRWTLLDLLFWMVLYPIILLRFGVVLFAVEVGTGLFLWGCALVLWGLISAAAGLVSLSRLRRKLLRGQPPDHRKDWRRRALLHRIEPALFLIVAAAFFAVLLKGWNDDVTDTGVQPWDGSAPLPFATMADLEPESRYTVTDLGRHTNTLEQRSDWLAPVVIRLGEAGTLSRPDGTALSGGLRVRYYETVSPWLARELYRELLNQGKTERDYAPLSLPPLDLDGAAAYSAIFPTLVLREGNRVMTVVFYQTGKEQIPLEAWSRVFAGSIKAQTR